jgi:hypothetical protein
LPLDRNLRTARSFHTLVSTHTYARSLENVLIKDGTFSLPGKKELLKSDAEYESVLIDATETPIERPQKNKGNTIPAKRKGIH